MLVSVIFALFSLTAAKADAHLTQLEAHCWHEAVDEGSFYCQFLMLMGKMEGHEGFVIPELAAPDSEEKTRIQADFACERLGFLYSTGFELKYSDKRILLARLEKDGAYAWEGNGAFIQHLKCE